MLVAIRDKDDAALKSMAVDRIKGWKTALPQFAMEMRERFLQGTGKPFQMFAGKSIVLGDVAAVQCTGPKELGDTYLALFFVRTDTGWKNFSLRKSRVSMPMETLLQNAAKSIKVSIPATQAAGGEAALAQLNHEKAQWELMLGQLANKSVTAAAAERQGLKVLQALVNVREITYGSHSSEAMIARMELLGGELSVAKADLDRMQQPMNGGVSRLEMEQQRLKVLQAEVAFNAAVAEGLRPATQPSSRSTELGDINDIIRAAVLPGAITAPATQPATGPAPASSLRVEAAEVQLQKAQDLLKTARKSMERGAASQAEVDWAQYNAAIAKLNLELAIADERNDQDAVGQVRIKAAQLALDRRQQVLERLEKAHAQGGADRGEVDEARNGVRMAQLGVEMEKARAAGDALEQAMIRVKAAQQNLDYRKTRLARLEKVRQDGIETGMDEARQDVKLAEIQLKMEQAELEKVLSSAPSTQPATQPAGSRLEFRIAPTPESLDKAELNNYMDWLQAGRVGFWWKGGRIAGTAGRMPQYAWLPIEGESKYPNLVTGKYQGKEYLLVSDKPGQVMASGEGKDAWGITDTYIDRDGFNNPALMIELDDNGGKLFAALTKENLRSPLALIIDGKVLSAPTIMAVIAKRVQITGRFTQKEVRDLAKALRAGMPPAKSPATQPASTAATEVTLPTDADLAVDDTLQPEDLVDVTVLGLFTDGLETVLRRQVSSKGLLDLPYLKDISAKGQTPAQLKAAIAKAYADAKILVNPVVSVTLVQRHQAEFYVVGGVSRPGAYAMTRSPDLRLLQALVTAGGVTDDHIKTIYVIRQEPTPASGPAVGAAQRVIAIDLAQLNKGVAKMNIVIRDDDVVQVALDKKLQKPEPQPATTGSDKSPADRAVKPTDADTRAQFLTVVGEAQLSHLKRLWPQLLNKDEDLEEARQELGDEHRATVQLKGEVHSLGDRIRELAAILKAQEPANPPPGWVSPVDAVSREAQVAYLKDLMWRVHTVEDAVKDTKARLGPDHAETKKLVAKLQRLTSRANALSLALKARVPGATPASPATKPADVQPTTMPAPASKLG